MDQTEQFVKANLDGPERYAQDAIKLGPIRLYVVYAEADQKDAKKLLDLLDPHFRIHNIQTWSHTDILPGEDRAKTRARARGSCDLTLQFLSPQFEADGLRSEATARVVPVLLHPLAHEPKDIEIFRHAGKSFDEAK